MIKYFDESWVETTPENAMYVVELEFDDVGAVVSSKTYVAAEKLEAKEVIADEFSINH